jgi:hypothetical protein
MRHAVFLSRLPLFHQKYFPLARIPMSGPTYSLLALFGHTCATPTLRALPVRLLVGPPRLANTSRQRTTTSGLSSITRSSLRESSRLRTLFGWLTRCRSSESSTAHSCLTHRPVLFRVLFSLTRILSGTLRMM